MEELVGKLWDRWIRRVAYRGHPEAGVALDELERGLAVFFRGLGGDSGLQIAATMAGAHGVRRGLVQRLAGTGTHAHLSWRDATALRLPPVIDLFPRREHNRYLYIWLAALHTAPDFPDTQWFYGSQLKTLDVLARFPGLGRVYERLAQACLELRPDPDRLPAADGAAERAIRLALLSPGSIEILPCGRQAPDPVPLWPHPRPPSPLDKRRRAGAEDAAASPAAGRRDSSRDNKRRHAERVDTPENKAPLLLYRFESIFTHGEFVNLNRGLDEDEDGADKRRRADDMEVLSIARGGTRAAALRFDLDLPPEDDGERVLESGVLLPEWDYRRHRLLQDQCRLLHRQAAAAPAQPLPERLRPTARRLRAQFEQLLPQRQRLYRQADGDEPDLEAYVNYCGERRGRGIAPEPRLYSAAVACRRDLACLLLADLSLSTDAWISDEQRVIDVIRDSLWLFSESLAAARDRFAICGFSSRRREHIRFTTLKDFAENYTQSVSGRIAAIKPGFYTRMGAAVRQATRLLGRERNQRRLLLLLSDGKPNDLDRYEGRYGVEDTRAAIQEARRQGVHPFCVTIDTRGADYLPHMFGAGAYTVIRDPHQLPRQLPALYARLTR